MKALLLVNRASGGYHEATVKACVDSLRRAGIDLEVLYPPGRDGFRDSLSRALGRYDVIIIGGGDGTVGLSANILAGRGQPIAILPLGRGNTFYKSVYGDVEPCNTIVRSLSGGVVRNVDVGYIVELDRFFVLGASLGFMAEAAVRARKYRFLGGRTAYAVAALEGVIAGIETPRCIVEVDGSQVYSGYASLLAAGITKYRAGRFKLFPKAELDDGMIDYLVIPRLSRLKALRVLRASIRGLHVGLEGIVYGLGFRIVFECSGELMAEADGDLIGTLRSMTVIVRSGALSILVPPS